MQSNKLITLTKLELLQVYDRVVDILVDYIDENEPKLATEYERQEMMKKFELLAYEQLEIKLLELEENFESLTKPEQDYNIRYNMKILIHEVYENQ